MLSDIDLSTAKINSHPSAIFISCSSWKTFTATQRIPPQFFQAGGLATGRISFATSQSVLRVPSVDTSGVGISASCSICSRAL